MEVIWLFCPDVKKLAGADLDLMQSLSMAIGFERKTENNPITIVFAGINDHLHSRGLLSKLRNPATAEAAVRPAIKNIMESVGEIIDVLRDGSYQRITTDGLKFVYAMVALLAEGM